MRFAAHIGMLTAFVLGASMLTFLEAVDVLLTWLLSRDCCNGPRLDQSEDDAGVKSLDALSRARANRTPSFTTDSLQSRDYLTRDCNSRDLAHDMRDGNTRDYVTKRPYVKFHQMNHVRGSGSEV